jgi:HD-like signal output (HDOD) protein
MPLDPDQLVNDSSKIPSLPLIYHEITTAIDDPESSTVSIGNVISKDSGLSVRLLRIANSSLYNFPGTVDTISQAIIVIGIQQIRDLALSTMVIELFEGISDDLVNMNSFWKHSLACGIAARVLAAQRREANVERYLVSGVLHDLGRLVLYLRRPDEARQALMRSKENGELLHRVEKEIFGFDHADVGGSLLKYWKLPDNLVQSITCHHYPQKATAYRTETAIIHVADIVANSLRLGSSGENFVPPVQAGSWERLNLSSEAIGLTVKEIDRAYQSATEMFLRE